MQTFLKRKNIKISFKTYLIDALSYMTLGLFASLIIGLIIQTVGEQLQWPVLEEMGQFAMSMMGPAIGAAVAYGLGAPPLVIFSAIAAGYAGTELGGGPAGAYIAALLATEIGKVVSKETKIDIIVTPVTTIIVGFFTAKFVGPLISDLMRSLGDLIVWGTEQEPIFMGIIVSALMGLALTAPISSAAIALMLDLSGLAAGAATIGCCAHMVGFAVSSYRENKVGGLLAMGLGTSMLQMPNIMRYPLILLPPTIASIIVAPFATTMGQMMNNAAGAGMGTSGLVGPIMTLKTMGFTADVWIKIAIFYIIAPAVISLLVSEIMRKFGWIKEGQMKINI